MRIVMPPSMTRFSPVIKSFSMSVAMAVATFSGVPSRCSGTRFSDQAARNGATSTVDQDINMAEFLDDALNTAAAFRGSPGVKLKVLHFRVFSSRRVA
jgi:hypothetical protein